jgi:Ca2+-binding EF-hand superfamily protein
MRDYARALITRFDRDLDGLITFQELCDGLDQFDIDLSLKDKMSLMKKLDVDADGEITEAELARALQTVDAEIINESVTTALKKISAGSEGYPNMRDYVRDLVRKFDHNSDGLISINELSEGLSKIHIYLNQREV